MPAPELTFGCNLNVEGYWDVAEFARRAEELGFDRVTMGEHVMDGNPPRPTLMNIPARRGFEIIFKTETRRLRSHFTIDSPDT